MVGLPYDLLLNPLGAVRYTFEKSVAALSSTGVGGDPPLAFRGKDFGAVELFRSFLFEQDGLSQVPILDASSHACIQPNTLVRFRGMVQDMLGNEFYIGSFKEGSTWRTNKYTDFTSYPVPHACETQLWERHLFHCVTVPGLNSWAVPPSDSSLFQKILGNSMSQHGGKRGREGDEAVEDMGNSEGASTSNKRQKDEQYHNAGANTEIGFSSFSQDSFSCLLKVYDIPENQIKLNDVIEFVGIYTVDPEFSIPDEDLDSAMDDLMEDATAHFPGSKVPRVHCLVSRKLSGHDFLPTPNFEPSVEMLSGLRASLLSHLTTVLGNDKLAAECLLLHLVSKVLSKVDAVKVGCLSLNFVDLTRESALIFGNQLKSVLQSLLPCSQTIRLSVEFLNTVTLQPRKDNATGRLATGVLQLPEGIHLMFDETCLQPGTLNSKGIENARLLGHMMEWQTVEYDFEYYKLEMPCDAQMLVLSDGKSNLLPADLIVPLRPCACPQTNTSEDLMQKWRWYLATVRSLPCSTEPSMYEKLQDEMVSVMRGDRSLGCKDLSRLLTMAQLMAGTFGRESLTVEHWLMVKQLESNRRGRLA